MTAAPFLADLSRRGIRLTVDGLQLRVRGWAVWRTAMSTRMPISPPHAK